MDPESVNQIVKAIMSLHDGRTLKPETVVAFLATLAAVGAAIATYKLGKGQIAAAKENAQKQIDAAREAAQRQIESAQAVAKKQIESAQEVAKKQIESAQAVARMNLAAPARHEWEMQLRGKLASFLAHCFFVYQHPDLQEENRSSLTMATIGFELSLMLDPMENVDRGLQESLQKVSMASTRVPRDVDAFEEALKETRTLAHFVLKG